MKFIDVRIPTSVAASAAEDVARRHYPYSLLEHCRRTFLWAVSYAQIRLIEFDAELLYVASMLHDIGLTACFDSFKVPFEEAGGEVAAVLAAGAGWSLERQRRLCDVIVKHMWSSVPEEDPEGHLLEVATAIDISGLGVDVIPGEFRSAVLEGHPRAGLPEVFGSCIRSQSLRKPNSSSRRFVATGGVERLARNPLDGEERNLGVPSLAKSASLAEKGSVRPGLIYRSAGPSDAEGLSELWRRFGGPARRSGNSEMALRVINNPSSVILVAADKDQVVGSLILGSDGWRCHLYRLAVDRAYRRTGIASELVSRAIEQAGSQCPTDRCDGQQRQRRGGRFLAVARVLPRSGRDSMVL